MDNELLLAPSGPLVQSAHIETARDALLLTRERVVLQSVFERVSSELFSLALAMLRQGRAVSSKLMYNDK